MDTAKSTPFEITALAVSLGRAYSSSHDKSLTEWDLDAFSPGRVFRGHQSYVCCLDVVAGRMGVFFYLFIFCVVYSCIHI
jgi:hypothetical protein